MTDVLVAETFDLFSAVQSSVEKIGVQRTEFVVACAPNAPRTRVFWLQGVTLVWMLVEFGVAAYWSA